ncbi:MAG: T9SS type A sorting domain-containing protein [Bacteroidetes bacterium]|nr:T9SS type A sorting domain-containing protein [Bacteroidota bacterium]
MRLILTLTTLLSITPLFGQPFGSPVNQKVGIIQNGRIFTVFSNTGVIGQPSSSGPRFAWLHQNNGYYGDLSFVTSMKVKMNAATDFTSPAIQTLLTKHPDSSYFSSIINDATRPAKGQEQSPEGLTWSYQPRAGFDNHHGSSVAISDQPDTWPYWKGYTTSPFQYFPYYFIELKDDFVETFFVMDDHSDDEFNRTPFNHVPVATVPERKGLGIRAEVRYLLPDPQKFGPVSDVFFMVHKFVNESDHDYSEFMLSFIVGNYVGATGHDDSPLEYDDDVSKYDSVTKTLYSWDFPGDNSRNPNWIGKPGFTGIRQISPSRYKYGSYFAPANDIDLRDDEALRTQLMKIDLGDIFNSRGEDGDGLVSSDLFTLKSGDSLEFVTMVGFGESLTILDQVLDLGADFWKAKFEPTDLAYFLVDQKNLNLKNTQDQTIPLITKNIGTEETCSVTLIDLKTRQEISLGTYPLNETGLTIDLSSFRGDEYQFKIDPTNDELIPFSFIATIEPTGTILSQEWDQNPLTTFEFETNPFSLSPTDSFDITFERVLKYNFFGPDYSQVTFINLVTGDSVITPGFSDQSNERNIYFSIQDGLSAKINNAMKEDLFDSESSHFEPDSVRFQSFSPHVKIAGNMYLRVMKLFDFKVQPGVDTSKAVKLLGTTITSKITPFTIRDENDKRIPFIFINRTGTSDNLGAGDQLFLLFNEGFTETYQDTIKGPDNSTYRFANRIFVTSWAKIPANQDVESAEVTYHRAFKGKKTIRIKGSTLLSARNEQPSQLQIGNPYPNPFNPSVAIRINSATRQVAKILIYNALGQVVESWDEAIPAGETTLKWSPKSGLSSGLYFISVSASIGHQVRKAVFLK